MAYRYGNRTQMQLFPQSIENYVSVDDPVRVYDAFVDVLNFNELGLELDDKKAGNCEYDPRTTLKLLVYSYSYGWKSSRKIERAIHHNVSFMWLMGGLKPDHKTIAEFRSRHKKALQKVLKQCVRMCIKLDVIDGNILFADSTKIRASASRNKNYTKEQYEKIVRNIDKAIEKLLKSCEQADIEEQDAGSYIQIKKELTDKQNLRQKMQACLAEFNSGDKETKSINSTDPDSKIMRSIQGSHASYNVQNVVDDKHGLIVHAQSTSSPTDHSQLSVQTEQAQQNTKSVILYAPMQDIQTATSLQN